MAEYNFTYESTFTDDFFFQYMNDQELPYNIVGLKAKDHKYVTVTTDRELTTTELESLNTLIQDYSDFNQTVVDNTILDKCRLHGEWLMREFELRNMNAKRDGVYNTIDIARVMEEVHDAYIFMSILRGSYEALLVLIDSFEPKYPVGSTYAYKTYVDGTLTSLTQEITQDHMDQLNVDLDWAKTQVLTFLASL